MIMSGEQGVLAIEHDGADTAFDYAARRGRLDAWYVCDRARGYRGEPNCQSIAGPPIDKAIGMLIAEQMTPAAVELTLEIRREIDARYEEADRLRCRAIERAQIEADLAQRRFMLVDPNNRLVADTLEGDGTTSSACWPKPAKIESAHESRISSSSMKLSANG
jgi:hypothetical protein